MIIKRVRTGCIHRFWMDHNRRLVRLEREVDWHVVTFLWCVPPVATKHGRARCCGDRKLHCRWWCDPRICVGLQSALREASLGHSTWSIYLNLLGRQRPSYGSFYWGHYRRGKKIQSCSCLNTEWCKVGSIMICSGSNFKIFAHLYCAAEVVPQHFDEGFPPLCAPCCWRRNPGYTGAFLACEFPLSGSFLYCLKFI